VTRKVKTVLLDKHGNPKVAEVPVVPKGMQIDHPLKTRIAGDHRERDQLRAEIKRLKDAIRAMHQMAKWSNREQLPGACGALDSIQNEAEHFMPELKILDTPVTSSVDKLEDT
jgi:hypothetical protein